MLNSKPSRRHTSTSVSLSSNRHDAETSGGDLQHQQQQPEFVAYPIESDHPVLSFSASLPSSPAAASSLTSVTHFIPPHSLHHSHSQSHSMMQHPYQSNNRIINPSPPSSASSVTSYAASFARAALSLFPASSGNSSGVSSPLHSGVGNHHNQIAPSQHNHATGLHLTSSNSNTASPLHHSHSIVAGHITGGSMHSQQQQQQQQQQQHEVIHNIHDIGSRIAQPHQHASPHQHYHHVRSESEQKVSVSMQQPHSQWSQQQQHPHPHSASTTPQTRTLASSPTISSIMPQLPHQHPHSQPHSRETRSHSEIYTRPPPLNPRASLPTNFEISAMMLQPQLHNQHQSHHQPNSSDEILIVPSVSRRGEWSTNTNSRSGRDADIDLIDLEDGSSLMGAGDENEQDSDTDSTTTNEFDERFENQQPLSIVAHRASPMMTSTVQANHHFTRNSSKNNGMTSSQVSTPTSAASSSIRSASSTPIVSAMSLSSSTTPSIGSSTTAAGGRFLPLASHPAQYSFNSTDGYRNITPGIDGMMLPPRANATPSSTHQGIQQQQQQQQQQQDAARRMSYTHVQIHAPPMIPPGSSTPTVIAQSNNTGDTTKVPSPRDHTHPAGITIRTSPATVAAAGFSSLTLQQPSSAPLQTSPQTSHQQYHHQNQHHSQHTQHSHHPQHDSQPNSHHNSLPPPLQPSTLTRSNTNGTLSVLIPIYSPKMEKQMRRIVPTSEPESNAMTNIVSPKAQNHAATMSILQQQENLVEQAVSRSPSVSTRKSSDATVEPKKQVEEEKLQLHQQVNTSEKRTTTDAASSSSAKSSALTKTKKKPNSTITASSTSSQQFTSFTLRIISSSSFYGLRAHSAMPLPQPGELIVGRYKMVRVLGTAAFSTTIEAVDLEYDEGGEDGDETGSEDDHNDDNSSQSLTTPKQEKHVCMKLVRNHAKEYFDQCLDEIRILKLLNQEEDAELRKNPTNKKRRKLIMRYLDSFYYHETLIIVLEMLGKNLYQVVKQAKEDCSIHVMAKSAEKEEKMGEGVSTLPPISQVSPPTSAYPFPLSSIRAVAYQLVRTLSFVHARHFIHADIKPENILIDVDEKEEGEKNGEEDELLQPRIKLIDYGSAIYLPPPSSASSSQQSQPLTYIQSRPYRAPEILLGLAAYTNVVDMWSVGCVLFELFTGDVLFPSASPLAQQQQQNSIIRHHHHPSSSLSHSHHGSISSYQSVLENMHKMSELCGERGSGGFSSALLKRILTQPCFGKKQSKQKDIVVGGDSEDEEEEEDDFSAYYPASSSKVLQFFELRPSSANTATSVTTTATSSSLSLPSSTNVTPRSASSNSISSFFSNLASPRHTQQQSADGDVCINILSTPNRDVPRGGGAMKRQSLSQLSPAYSSNPSSTSSDFSSGFVYTLKPLLNGQQYSARPSPTIGSFQKRGGKKELNPSSGANNEEMDSSSISNEKFDETTTNRVPYDQAILHTRMTAPKVAQLHRPHPLAASFSSSTHGVSQPSNNHFKYGTASSAEEWMEYLDFMSRLLTIDPMFRMSASDASTHPFLARFVKL